jgi:hypothetical protein
MFGAWCGPLSALCFALSFIIPGFLPPTPPNLTSSQVADVFRSSPNLIRLGMILMMYAGSFLCLFTAAIAVQLRRIETVHPFWTYAQLVTGASAGTMITIGAVLMSTATFRPERAPDLTYLLYDLSWMMIVMPGTPAVFQNLSLGMGILSDQSASPVFPRWVGYFNLWTATLYTGGALVAIFKEGIFAWNGLMAFWIPAVCFGAWFVVMFLMLKRAIQQQPDTKRAAAG